MLKLDEVHQTHAISLSTKNWEDIVARRCSGCRVALTEVERNQFVQLNTPTVLSLVIRTILELFDCDDFAANVTSRTQEIFKGLQEINLTKCWTYPIEDNSIFTTERLRQRANKRKAYLTFKIIRKLEVSLLVRDIETMFNNRLCLLWGFQ